MRLFYTLSIVLATVLSGFAQTNSGKTENDPAAKTILDRVSTKYQSYNTLEVDFSLSIVSKVDGLNESMKGYVWLKGQKYRVNTDDVEIICDNVKRWMVLKGEQKEVQINFYEPDANNIESPSQLFTIYKNNYYYRLDGKESLDGKPMNRIQLVPTNPKESPYTYVYLLIDAEDVIRKARIIGKDGVEYNWQIVKFAPNTKIEDSKFTFNAAQYPGYHIEDLTSDK
jgi:outer membrane lipoprotein-sorting protein